MTIHHRLILGFDGLEILADWNRVAFSLGQAGSATNSANTVMIEE